MTIFEYDEELHKQTLLREGYEDGYTAGAISGRQEGREEGMQEGILQTLFDLYKSGILSLEQCSEKSGLEESDFIKKYEEYYENL